MNAQPNLFPDVQKRDTILGNQHHEAVDKKLDRPRLLGQYDRILDFMREHGWVTQYEVAAALDVPQGSVGSQIRNARVDGWIIPKRRRGGGKSGTWEYMLTGKKEDI